MNQGHQADDQVEVPPSLRRERREAKRQIQFHIPVSWYVELKDLAREFDQDISAFIREATEDWLKRARKVRAQIPEDEL